MEFHVDVQSSKTRKFFEAILPSMIQQLNLENSRKLLVVKTDNMPDLGLTIPMDEINTYLVVVKSNRKLIDMGSTLAHEMVHVRQMAKGMLKETKNGQIWMGKRYLTNKTKYLDRPWEQDAFAQQEIVFRRAIDE